MGQYIEQIITAARRSLAYADKLAADVKPEIFARKPRFRSAAGEVIVDCNHPAFVYGHLSLYPARLMGFMAVDTAPVAAPAHYGDLFKAGLECKDDPEGKIYPKREEILAYFTRGYHGLLETLAKSGDELLLKPHPDEQIRAKFFPTLGTAMVFMTNNHVSMHMGQISTWRRCFGLPGVM